ncbi:MAG: tetratricopeptide repeat protein [Okeania sp. SIO3B3]|nr:tetratricopeptide repeat protein [Okeania sp. SIO3B3]
MLTNNPSTKGIIFNNIGAVYRRLKEFPKALKFYQEALEIHQKNQDRFAIATTLDNIGVIYREQGKYSQALEFHQQALERREKLGDREGLAATIHNIGIVYRESGSYAEALQFLTHTLIIDKQLGNRDGERITLGNIGKLLAKDRPELAIIFYKQSVNVTEDIRQDLKVLPVEEQQSYVESVAEIYRSLADLLLQQKRVMEAYQILDLLKVQEIFEYIGSLESDEYKSTEVPLLEMEKKFWQKYNQFIDAVSQDLDENQNISSAKLVDIQNLIDSQEVTNIVLELKKNASSQKLNVEILASLQSELKKHQQENAVVLYPLLLEDRIELILVSANSLPLHRTVLVKQEEFEEALIEFRVGLTSTRKVGNKNRSDDRAIKGGLKFYNWLIKPIESHLKISGAKTIIYAPDGKLRYIPLAGLYDGEKWLVERFKINNITAASLIKFIPREEVNPQILAGALTEGNYKFIVAERRFDFNRLPFAGVEVEKLAKIFPRTKKLLGNAFTKEAMESNMGSYNIVHFATHSAFVSGHPEESFILFGDGNLTNLRGKHSAISCQLFLRNAAQTALIRGFYEYRLFQPAFRRKYKF